ncbi:hypothetical protein LMG28140_05304 [Paraburkholderia metrosideri]|uniref:KOW domain-containing protein n=1 Tax=Paraburkholderia metrosideri TaxID=580937 RepID=A0ABM8P1K8_9BURK|nr:hypothetical protein LMG28140_05304 [Paraburkholderia metrosideri]
MSDVFKVGDRVSANGRTGRIEAFEICNGHHCAKLKLDHAFYRIEIGKRHRVTKAIAAVADLRTAST